MIKVKRRSSKFCIKQDVTMFFKNNEIGQQGIFALQRHDIVIVRRVSCPKPPLRHAPGKINRI